MPATPKPLFVARQSYRRRRLIDAARALPVLGALLFALPILWSRPSLPEEARVGLAERGLYIFAVWLLLVAAAALVSRPLFRGGAGDPGGQGGDAPGGSGGVNGGSER